MWLHLARRSTAPQRLSHHTASAVPTSMPCGTAPAATVASLVTAASSSSSLSRPGVIPHDPSRPVETPEDRGAFLCLATKVPRVSALAGHRRSNATVTRSSEGYAGEHHERETPDVGVLCGCFACHAARYRRALKLRPLAARRAGSCDRALVGPASSRASLAARGRSARRGSSLSRRGRSAGRWSRRAAAPGLSRRRLVPARDGGLVAAARVPAARVRVLAKRRLLGCSAWDRRPREGGCL